MVFNLPAMKMSPMTPAARLDEKDRRYRRLMGLYINELRIRRGMSQDDLAGKSGLSRTEIHNIEHGLTSQLVTTMWRVCDGLNMPYGEVVTHMDYVMDHPECQPPHLRLKTMRGMKSRKVHANDGESGSSR